MHDFDYSKAEKIEGALGEIATRENGAFLAGGTNLIDLMKYNVEKPDVLIDVSSVVEMQGISELENGGLLLGAAAKNADSAWHPLVETRYPLLSKAILAGASGQIRNMASNGGNLLQRTRCHYFYDVATPCNKRKPGSGCPARTGQNRMMAILGHSNDCIAVFPSDMCIALAALEAIVHVQSASGTRQIAFADFHRLPGNTPWLDNNLQPGELITGIELPAEGFAKHYSYLKLRDRQSYAFATISVATGLHLEDGKIAKARIALGGVAHKPWRVPVAEDLLIGKEPTKENFSLAADEILAGAQGFEHNNFKIELARRAIIHNGMMALEPEKTQMVGAAPN